MANTDITPSMAKDMADFYNSVEHHMQYVLGTIHNKAEMGYYSTGYNLSRSYQIRDALIDKLRSMGWDARPSSSLQSGYDLMIYWGNNPPPTDH